MGHFFGRFFRDDKFYLLKVALRIVFVFAILATVSLIN